MAVKILHKRSAVQFKNATSGQLEFGELGLNYHESGPYLQCKDTNGKVINLGGVYLTGENGTAPGNPLEGRFWLQGETLNIYNGTEWVAIAGTGDDTGGIQNIVGGDGIKATTVGDTTTIEADLDNLGLEINDSGQIALNIGSGLAFDTDDKLIAIGGGGGDFDICVDGGLTYDSTDECYLVDWEKLPTGDGLDWGGSSWDVDWEQLPTDNSLDWDTNKWVVDWEQFPGGDNIDWDPVDKDWNVTLKDPIIIDDNAPDPVVDNYFWWDSSKGELFLGYTDEDDDSYWIAATKPGKDGEDGVPVVISQDTAPDFVEDAIWFNTATGEAFFGYLDPSGDEYWISLVKPGQDGKDGDPVVISQDTAPDFVEDAIWFNTATGEAFFGYKDPSGDEYWVGLVKPGQDGKDGEPVIISQDAAPDFVEDAIWFNTNTGEAFFGYKDPSDDEYWVSLVKPGKDGVTVIVGDNAPGDPVDGQIWHNSRTGTAYAYWETSGVWVSM